MTLDEFYFAKALAHAYDSRCCILGVNSTNVVGVVRRGSFVSLPLVNFSVNCGQRFKREFLLEYIPNKISIRSSSVLPFDSLSQIKLEKSNYLIRYNHR